MHLVIAIHKDPNSDYGVTVPERPGCFSAGRTFAQALSIATEAIDLHLESLINDGVELPVPSVDIEGFRLDPYFDDVAWAVMPESVSCGAPSVGVPDIT